MVLVHWCNSFLYRIYSYFLNVNYVKKNLKNEVHTSRKDARVHECGHTEIGQCEEEDHSIIEWNGGGEPV